MAALRNLAIRAVRTTHFIVLDVDLWPSASLHDAAMAAPPALLRSKYTALVIPAFALDLPPPPTGDADAVAGFFEASFDRVPSTTGELKECVRTKQCSTFYAHSSPETHATTPYREWWESAAGAQPLFIPCFRNARYEPYVVLPNSARRTHKCCAQRAERIRTRRSRAQHTVPTTPIYSEAFTGYGKNKIELVTHLRFAGFRFYALPAAFVTHMPHVKSAQKLAWEVCRRFAALAQPSVAIARAPAGAHALIPC